MSRENKGDDTPSYKEKKEKKYIAIETKSIHCNKKFQLVKGEEIPKGIDKSFIESLINSNLIKIS